MSITIKHLDGPLKGETTEFADGVGTILIGRQAGCQIVYPAEYTVVGKTHCQLERQISGDYCVRLLGDHFVEIDGVPADNLARVPNGSTLRLGDRKTGPSFKAEIVKAKAELPDTGQQTQVKSWRQQIGEMKVLVGRLLAVLLLAFVGYFLLRTATLEEQIASANETASELARQQFTQATKDKLLAAVYLVAKDEDGKPRAEGTAWAFRARTKCSRPTPMSPRRSRATKRSTISSLRTANASTSPASPRIRATCVRHIQDDARHDALGQLHATRSDQRIRRRHHRGEHGAAQPARSRDRGRGGEAEARHQRRFGRISQRRIGGLGNRRQGAGDAAFRRDQRPDRCVHVPGRAGASLAAPAQRPGDRRRERQPTGRARRQGHRHRQWRQYRGVQGHQGRGQRQSATAERGADQFRPAHRSVARPRARRRRSAPRRRPDLLAGSRPAIRSLFRCGCQKLRRPGHGTLRRR